MANVIAIASITFEDYLGKKASVPHYIALSDTSTVASLITAFGTLLALVNPLSSGSPISGSLRIDTTTTPTTPTTGVPVNVGGGFDFNQHADPYAFAEVIPAFNPACWGSGLLPAPDPGNAAVASYVTALTSSNGLGTGFSAISKFDNSLTSLRDTFQANRKYKRQSRRSVRS